MVFGLVFLLGTTFTDLGQLQVSRTMAETVNQQRSRYFFFADKGTKLNFSRAISQHVNMLTSTVEFCEKRAFNSRKICFDSVAFCILETIQTIRGEQTK